MSEYQYYEFQAIDKPLTNKDMQELRALSTKAKITPTSFVNEYHWGDFKGDPLKLMGRYFDAFLYFANWGTHSFMLRIPRNLMDVELVKKYSLEGESLTIHEKNDYLIFEFTSETEDYEWEEDEDQLSSLISLRSDLINGDYRCLYLAWLLGIQGDGFEDDLLEPPVPQDLNKLNASLEIFIDFMRIDKDLIDVAAEKSTAKKTSGDCNEELKSWIMTLPEREKNEIIFNLINNNDLYLGTQLMQRFKNSINTRSISGLNSPPSKSCDLLEKAKIQAEERKHQIAKQKATEKARKEKEAKEAREKYLNNLTKREDKVWEKINTFIDTKKPADYDAAVQLLVDLRDLSFKKGKSVEFKEEIQKIKEKHKRKPSFLERLQSAGIK